MSAAKSGTAVPAFRFASCGLLAMMTAMTAVARARMTVDEFLAWAEDQPGRYELYDGVVYAMTPERAAHAKIKFAVQAALAAAIRARGLPCHMLPDGMTVRVANEDVAQRRIRVFQDDGRDAIAARREVRVARVSYFDVFQNGSARAGL